MVVRPYHDYSTSALRELSRDLASSQVQVKDQRADYLRRGGSHDDDLRELDALIGDLGDQLAAVDRELGSRQRDRTTATAGRQRGVTHHPDPLRRRGPRVTQDNPKPHCRAKTDPAADRRPR